MISFPLDLVVRIFYSLLQLANESGPRPTGPEAFKACDDCSTSICGICAKHNKCVSGNPRAIHMALHRASETAPADSRIGARCRADQRPINISSLAIPIPVDSNNKSLIYLILVVFPSHLIRAQMILWRAVPGSSTEMALLEMRIGIPV